MAFVPELDDPNKKDESEETSDISAQAAPTTAAAPATGGQAVGGNPANSSSKSSGNFQDFSKFKAANQNKLSALSNLATGQAQGNVDKAKSAFDNAGSAYQTEIQKNAKNFDTSGYKDLNVNSQIDADKIGADIAVTKQDAGAYQGKLAGTEAYTGLQSAENQVGQLGTRAGTAGVLSQYGAEKGDYSGTAANQDALLLQSIGDYRQKANQIAQGAKGVTQNALTQNQAKIGETAAKVDATNQDYRTKALDALRGVQTGITTDLTNRAKAGESERVAANDKTYADARAKTIQEIRAAEKMKVNNAYQNKYPITGAVGDTDPNSPQNRAIRAAGNGDMAGFQAAMNEVDPTYGMSDDDVFAKYQNGATAALQNFQTDNARGQINADTIFAGDSQRQAQQTALQRLLGGEAINYNSGAAGPVASQALSPLESLLSDIRVKSKIPDSVAAQATKEGEAWAAKQKADAEAKARATPAPTKTGSGGGGGSNINKTIQR